MQEVQRRSCELATSDEPAIPSGLVEFLSGEYEVAEEFFSGVDKAATFAERAFTTADLQRDQERTRPHTLVPQRDSDAKRDVLASRHGALSRFSSQPEDGGGPHPAISVGLRAAGLLHDIAARGGWS